MVIYVSICLLYYNFSRKGSQKSFEVLFLKRHFSNCSELVSLFDDVRADGQCGGEGAPLALSSLSAVSASGLCCECVLLLSFILFLASLNRDDVCQVTLRRHWRSTCSVSPQSAHRLGQNDEISFILLLLDDLRVKMKVCYTILLAMYTIVHNNILFIHLFIAQLQ